ncbi:MAG: exonuclease SbcCD subunit D C-terminal domain-containing protein [Desulfuromonadales bacterium]|nr:exonuclease SbcCD subunit D C-terminal domain-containing protein [Desulfuromonadales bacterium]
MKILHTSDWHLGRSLYGRKRYAEFSAFLDWLGDTIATEKIDVLLVAGDIFDTNTPSNRAQELYYRFLCRVSGTCCQHIVITAGNHDSPSFLDAPKQLLRALNVHVIGTMADNPADEVLVLKNNQLVNTAEMAIICAVPYLRDKDIRTVAAGETIEDKNRKLVEGLKGHYDKVVAIAAETRDSLQPATGKHIPIVAMGHLFTAGGKTVDGDGVRDLYVGSLAYVGVDTFPAAIDYLALGHLHVPQKIGTSDHIRYSGSPLPMGFGEAKQEKSVVIIEFNQQITPQPAAITLYPVPCFQQLERIAGSLDDIDARIKQLKQEGSQAWLEIEYTGSDIIGNLQEMLAEAMADSGMEIRRISNQRLMERVINALHQDETLDDLDTSDVFERCLTAFDVAPEERLELTTAYQEIVQNMFDADENAE